MVGDKLPRMGGKIPQGSLPPTLPPPGGGASCPGGGGKINCYNGPYQRDCIRDRNKMPSLEKREHTTRKIFSSLLTESYLSIIVSVES